MGTPVLTVCWSSPQLTSLSCDVEHPDMNNVKTTAIISLALLTVVTANREGGFVVRKKIKIPKNRDDSPGDSPREGRHLGLFTPLDDLFLRLQCSPQQCLTNPTTARICCSRNFNLNCCFYNPGPPLYSSPAVTTPALWTPQAPFSLGLSVQLSSQSPAWRKSRTIFLQWTITTITSHYMVTMTTTSPGSVPFQTLTTITVPATTMTPSPWCLG